MANIRKLNSYTKGSKIIKGNFLVSTDDPSSCISSIPSVVINNEYIEELIYSTGLGINSCYIGFGGSTGSFANEHWLHEMTWSSGLDQVSFATILANSNFLNNATLIGNSVRFTQATGGQTGNIFYTVPVRFIDRRGDLIDWSAYYVFSMGGGSRADGLSFILQSSSDTAGGYGGGLAYAGIPYSVAVGYDSYSNPGDPNSNHIELDVNGDVGNSLITYIPPFDMCGTTGTNKYIYNWVDYSKTGVIKIYVSTTNSKPSTPFITYSIDIRQYLVNPNL